MDSGIDSTESSNGSISDICSNIIDPNLDDNHDPSIVNTSEETIQNCSQSYFREPSSITNFKVKRGDSSSNKEHNRTTAQDASSTTMASPPPKWEEMKENEEKENGKNSDEYTAHIPRTPESFIVPDVLEFPLREGCCLRLNFPKIETEFAVPQEQVLPFEITPAPSFANGPLQVNYDPHPYGSLALLPYESRELRRKFKHYRKRLKQIISPELKEKKLRLAASLNNEELVERLLKEGVDPKSTDEKERTALHIAASKGFTNIAKLLLQNGADPNQKDSIGNTALHLAACTSHIQIVTLLLKAGTNVKQADNQGYSPLHLANSRLKLLQKDPNPSSQSLRTQVYQIVEMMQEYLKSSGNTEEAELLTALTSKLTLSEENCAADSDIKQLLASLQDLTLSKTKKD